uniref:Uncharacterized protein n=1 Tax=Leersia perrieri TaxID=77586 RepID=A0A0D9XPT2_9ORYZ
MGLTTPPVALISPLASSSRRRGSLGQAASKGPPRLSPAVNQPCLPGRPARRRRNGKIRRTGVEGHHSPDLLISSSWPPESVIRRMKRAWEAVRRRPTWKGLQLDSISSTRSGRRGRG